MAQILYAEGGKASSHFPYFPIAFNTGVYILVDSGPKATCARPERAFFAGSLGVREDDHPSHGRGSHFDMGSVHWIYANRYHHLLTRHLLGFLFGVPLTGSHEQ